MNEAFRYSPLSRNDLQSLWKKHRTAIKNFIENNEYLSDDIYVNSKSIMAVIAKLDQRKKYFQYFHGLDMSEFKEAALIAFWYIKLKPICIVNKNIQDSGSYEAINEKLALYYILSMYRTILTKQGLSTKVLDKLPKEYIKEILYSFEYRDISKEALILLVESIAVFLGINPYQDMNKKIKNIVIEDINPKDEEN